MQQEATIKYQDWMCVDIGLIISNGGKFNIISDINLRYYYFGITFRFTADKVERTEHTRIFNELRLFIW